MRSQKHTQLASLGISGRSRSKYMDRDMLNETKYYVALLCAQIHYEETTLNLRHISRKSHSFKPWLKKSNVSTSREKVTSFISPSVRPDESAVSHHKRKRHGHTALLHTIRGWNRHIFKSYCNRAVSNRFFMSLTRSLLVIIQTSTCCFRTRGLQHSVGTFGQDITAGSVGNI